MIAPRARRLAPACALALALAGAATAAAQQADPTTVTIAATRNWGPLTALLGHAGVPGRTSKVWLRGATLPARPSVLVNSGEGEDARVALAPDRPPPAGIPAGDAQYTLEAPATMGPGKYDGALPIGPSEQLGVSVLVQDAIWWQFIAVGAGIALAWGVRHATAGPRRRRRNQGHVSEWVVTGVAGLFTTFTFVTTQYGTHTFGAWQDYVAAIAAGALGHVLGHGLNQTTASSRPQA